MSSFRQDNFSKTDGDKTTTKTDTTSTKFRLNHWSRREMNNFIRELVKENGDYNMLTQAKLPKTWAQALKEADACCIVKGTDTDKSENAWITTKTIPAKAARDILLPSQNTSYLPGKYVRAPANSSDNAGDAVSELGDNDYDDAGPVTSEVTAATLTHSVLNATSMTDPSTMFRRIQNQADTDSLEQYQKWLSENEDATAQEKSTAGDKIQRKNERLADIDYEVYKTRFDLWSSHQATLVSDNKKKNAKLVLKYAELSGKGIACFEGACTDELRDELQWREDCRAAKNKPCIMGYVQAFIKTLRENQGDPEQRSSIA
jgi:hypothetical protein